MRMNPTASLAERLWARVNKTGTCWLWTGRVNEKGYGCIDPPRTPGVRPPALLAHRVSWELARGPIPSSLSVLHICDVAACVRPGHLFLGTRPDNNADMLAKGRTARGEAKHLKLTEQDVAEARRLWKAGGIMQKDLATRFGVNRATMSYVLRGKLWKHVT